MNKNQPFITGSLLPCERFVYRTPLLPLGEFFVWGGRDLEKSREHLRRLVERPEVREALGFASADLAANLPRWLEEPESVRGQKVERALVRYFARMCSRATPFGLFAGVSTGRVGERTYLPVPDAAGCMRVTRPDTDFLGGVAKALMADPAVRRALVYETNAGVHLLAGQVRFAVAKGPVFQLMAAEPSPVLLTALERARHGVTPEELANTLLVAHGRDIAAGSEEGMDLALSFIDQLIDAQLLVPELGVQVTGAPPLDAMLAVLQKRTPGHPATRALFAARRELAALDDAGPGGNPARYTALARTLAPIATPPVDPQAPGRFLRVDLVKPTSGAALGPEVVAAIERGLGLLCRITPAPVHQALDVFRQTFRDRYGDRAVPLLQALDEESGIGFAVSAAPGAEAAPLLAGLAFPRPEPEPVTWQRRDAYLLERMSAAGRELCLDGADIDALAAADPQVLPDAFEVMVRVAASSQHALERGRFRLLFGQAAGPPGARLLGRFGHASPELLSLVTEHLRAEEALRPDAVFAEIVHLDEAATGNLVCRPVLRDHEIVCLGLSGAPAPGRIAPADLLVAVRGDRVVLSSRRLGREVVPRLTCAHNIGDHAAGIYAFLYTLQARESCALRWSWGALAGARFLPRVTWGNLVFARATWRLGRADLAPVARATRDAAGAVGARDIRAARSRVVAAVADLCRSRDLPRHVVYKDGEGDDRELLFDLQNPLSANSFAHLVKSRAAAVLCELFPGPDELCASGPDGAYAHELVVSFTRAPGQPAADAASSRGRAREPAAVAKDPAIEPVRRRFAPGSEWLYAKLYTGVSTADRVLCRTVAPVRARALESGAASSWHFVRHADPHPHVRVRFFGPPEGLRDQVMPELERAVASLLEDETVWRLTYDTYEREVERYGGDAAIELVEQVFFADSEATLHILTGLSGQAAPDRAADARWRLAMRGCERLLCDLGMDLPSRHALIRRARAALEHEFRADVALRRQIGARFRAEASALIALIAPEPGRADDTGQSALAAPDPGFSALAQRSARLREPLAELLRRDRAGRLTAPREQIAASLLHMHVNRMLHDSQRAQEMVIYALMDRVYGRMHATKHDVRSTL